MIIKNVICKNNGTNISYLLNLLSKCKFIYIIGKNLCNSVVKIMEVI